MKVAAIVWSGVRLVLAVFLSSRSVGDCAKVSARTALATAYQMATLRRLRSAAMRQRPRPVFSARHPVFRGGHGPFAAVIGLLQAYPYRQVPFSWLRATSSKSRAFAKERHRFASSRKTRNDAAV